jgi:hypothetical protein
MDSNGSAEFSVQKLFDEHPEYFVLNGSVGALTIISCLRWRPRLVTQSAFSLEWAARTIPRLFT